jgi:hypothetical protein
MKCKAPLVEILNEINANLARLVWIQHKRFEVEKKMNIDGALLKSILDAANTALLQESHLLEDNTALSATIADLKTKIGPIPDDVQASIDSFLANAAAANPPADPVPVPPPTDPVPDPVTGTPPVDPSLPVDPSTVDPSVNP